MNSYLNTSAVRCFHCPRPTLPPLLCDIPALSQIKRPSPLSLGGCGPARCSWCDGRGPSPAGDASELRSSAGAWTETRPVDSVRTAVFWVDWRFGNVPQSRGGRGTNAPGPLRLTPFSQTTTSFSALRQSRGLPGWAKQSRLRSKWLFPSTKLWRKTLVVSFFCHFNKKIGQEIVKSNFIMKIFILFNTPNYYFNKIPQCLCSNRNRKDALSPFSGGVFL